MKNTTLYYREGGSDKVYQVLIEPKDGLFLVNFAFGRRGSTMNTGTKTSQPLPLTAATRLFEKLVREKKAKGYTEGAAGTPYQESDKAGQVSGILPQLLNPIMEHELPWFMNGSGWVMQEKFDGQRLMILKQGNETLGINRRGLIIALPNTLVQAARLTPGDWLMDGEVVGEMYYPFDLLQHLGKSLRHQPYVTRLQRLQQTLAGVALRHVIMVKSVSHAQAKEDYLALLKSDRREGVVFKRLDAGYTPGRPAKGGGQVKYKFYATASCLVAQLNPGKRSVRLNLLSGVRQVSAGNVTIPANAPMPKVGDILEVRYLYAEQASGALYQPVYLEERGDVARSECTVAQLKYRPITTEGDES